MTPLDQPARRLWWVVWQLLRLKLMMVLNSFRRANLRQKLSNIFLGLLMLVSIGFLFWLSFKMQQLLLAPEWEEIIGSPRFLLENLPSLIYGGAFIGLLFTSFGVLLQTLYLAGDMDFLLSKPTPVRAVFVVKVIQAVIPNFAAICLFALPTLFGLGASAGFSWVYYPAAVFLFLVLAIVAAGLASLIVMGVVRFFPARLVAEVLSLLGVFAYLLISLSGLLVGFVRSPTAAAHMRNLTQLIIRFNVPWSPLHWAGRGLLHIGAREWVEGLSFIAPLISASIVIFMIALATAERLYFSGWANLSAIPARKIRHQFFQRRASSSAVSFKQVKPLIILSLLQNDLALLRRDLRNMSLLVTPMIFAIVYFVVLVQGNPPTPPAARTTPIWMNEFLERLGGYGNVVMALYVGWLLVSRLGILAFAREGKYYWLLKSAPVGIQQLIAGKFLSAYLPTILVSWVLLLLTWLIRQPAKETMLFSFLTVTLTLAGNTGINLAMGIWGANLTWDDPQQMQRYIPGCLGFVVTVAYQVISLALYFPPAVMGFLLGLSEQVGQAIGLMLGGSFSLVCAILPPWLSRRKLARLGED